VEQVALPASSNAPMIQPPMIQPSVIQPPILQPPITQPVESATAGFTPIPQGLQPRFDPPAAATTVAASAPPPMRREPAPAAATTLTGFESVAALVASLPRDEASRPAPAPTRTPARPSVRVAERQPPPIRFDRSPSRTPADRNGQGRAGASRADDRTSGSSRTGRARPPANPSRNWVQIAGGADVRALPREYGRLKTMAPALLGSRAAWTTPLNATNRLLVGPFDTPAAAQAFVNQLVERRIAAFAWTSPAGQEIERLQTR
jgi:hypothetical protein